MAGLRVGGRFAGWRSAGDAGLVGSAAYSRPVPSATRAPFRIGGIAVQAGRRGQVELPIANLITGSAASLPVKIVHGRADGPTIWLSAAIHGDEICGVEIIRRVLQRLDPRFMKGTVIAVPVVNVYGFMANDRYFPDRRDLNRSFPGSTRGSLASRVAHLMMSQIVSRCEYGIDLHTGSDSRTNLPQVRGQLDDDETHKMALAFGAPIVIHARNRDGSLREAARAAGARVLVYEGGEPSRFDEDAIAIGTTGVLRVMQHLGIIRGDWLEPLEPPLESERTTWVRAGRSGILLSEANTGDWVEKGQLIGRIVDATGYNRARINATATGLIIGRRLHPLINQGDAVFHIAHIRPTGGPYASTEPDLTIGGADAPDANADVSQRQGRTQPQSTSEESPPAHHRDEDSAPGNAQTEDAADGAAGREPAAAIDDEPLDA